MHNGLPDCVFPQGPCPGSPDRRPATGRTLRAAFSCRDILTKDQQSQEALGEDATLLLRAEAVAQTLGHWIESQPAIWVTSCKAISRPLSPVRD